MSTKVAHRAKREGFLNIRFLGPIPVLRGVPSVMWDVDILPGVAYGGGALLRAASQSNGGGADKDGEEGRSSGVEYTNALSLDLRGALAEGGVATTDVELEGEFAAKVLARGAGPGSRPRRRFCAAGVA